LVPAGGGKGETFFNRLLKENQVKKCTPWGKHWGGKTIAPRENRKKSPFSGWGKNGKEGGGKRNLADRGETKGRCPVDKPQGKSLSSSAKRGGGNVCGRG